eukprot:2334878-Amphidinium_carterae.1
MPVAAHRLFGIPLKPKQASLSATAADGRTHFNLLRSFCDFYRHRVHLLTDHFHTFTVPVT